MNGVADRDDLPGISEVLARTGIDTTLADVSCEPNRGLFSFAGHRVILYKRQRVASVEDLDHSKPFHLLRCAALQANAERTHTARCSLTTRRDGKFSMVLAAASGDIVDLDTALLPCKICLAEIDFAGYRGARSAAKQKLRGSFAVADYFASYPISPAEEAIAPASRPPNDVYPDSWAAVSRTVREAANWTCSVCEVRCHDVKALLHTHHVNGIKADLRPENLRAVCISCHRNMPGHQTMYVSPAHSETIAALRHQQEHHEGSG